MLEEKEKSTSAFSFEYPDRSLDPIAGLGWLFVGSVLLRGLQVLQGPWDSHMKMVQSSQTECVVALPGLLLGSLPAGFSPSPTFTLIFFTFQRQEAFMVVLYQVHWSVLLLICQTRKCKPGFGLILGFPLSPLPE